MFLDPDHNGQLLPAGRKLQPLRNVAVIIFFSSSFKNKGHFQRASHYKTIAANQSTGGGGVLFVVVHVGGSYAVNRQRGSVYEDVLAK